MEHRWQRLDFLANLATIDLASLSPGGLLVLVETLERLWPDCEKPLSAASGKRGGAPAADVALRTAHKEIREFVVPLLEGKTVRRTLHLVLDEDGWVVEAPGDDATKSLDAVDNPVRTLHEEIHRVPGSPMPFRRCPNCHRVFAFRTLRRIYCSADCSSRAAEAKRRDEKRAKNRDYQRRRRAGERAGKVKHGAKEALRQR